MTVSSLTNRNDYTGNGAASVYSYTFRTILNTHLLVTVKDLLDVETTLVMTTDYTVTGVGADSGGTIVLVNSGQSWLDGSGNLLTGYALTVRRVLPLKQLTDIRNKGDFYPEVHEDQFDQLLMVDQQQQDEIDRSIKFNETSTSTGFFLPEPEASAVIAYNSTATALVALTLSDGGTSVSITGDQNVDGQKTFLDKIVASPDTAEAGIEINQGNAALALDINKTAGASNAVDVTVNGGSGDGVVINHSVNGNGLTINKSAGTGSAIDVGASNFTVQQNGSFTAANDAFQVDSAGQTIHTTSQQMDHISTPGSAPASGKVKIYPKSDNLLYILNSSSVEAAIALQSYVTGLLDTLTQYAHVSHSSLSNTLLTNSTSGIEFNLSNVTEVDANSIVTVANASSRTQFTMVHDSFVSAAIYAKGTGAGANIGFYVDGTLVGYSGDMQTTGEEITTVVADLPIDAGVVADFRMITGTIATGSTVYLRVTVKRRAYA